MLVVHSVASGFINTTARKENSTASTVAFDDIWQNSAMMFAKQSLSLAGARRLRSDIMKC
jgi:hypothetical protein